MSRIGMRACEEDLKSTECKNELEKIINESLRNVLSKKEEYMISRHPALSDSLEGFEGNVEGFDYDDYEDIQKLNKLHYFIDSELSRMKDSYKTLQDRNNQIISEIHKELKKPIIRRDVISSRLETLQASSKDIAFKIEADNKRFKYEIAKYVKSML